MEADADKDNIKCCSLLCNMDSINFDFDSFKDSSNNFEMRLLYH